MLTVGICRECIIIDTLTFSVPRNFVMRQFFKFLLYLAETDILNTYFVQLNGPFISQSNLPSSVITSLFLSNFPSCHSIIIV